MQPTPIPTGPPTTLSPTLAPTPTPTNAPVPTATPTTSPTNSPTASFCALRVLDSENGASDGVTIVGDWRPAIGGDGIVQGDAFIQDRGELKGEKSVEFAFAVELPRSLTLHMTYTTTISRATNVPVTVTHAGGQTTMLVNQQVLGSGPFRSFTLGSFFFNTGGSVKVETNGTFGKVVVDAVLLEDCSTPVPTATPTTAPTGVPTTSPTNAPTGVPTTSPTNAPTSSPTTAPTNVPTTSPTNAPTAAPTTAPTNAPTAAPTAPLTECVLGSLLVFDSESMPDGSTVAITGPWSTGTGGSGAFLGSSFFSDDDANKGALKIEFALDGFLPGQYNVFLTYTRSASRATNVPVLLTDRSGTALSTINQQVAGSGTLDSALAGSVVFVEGDAAVVVDIRNTGTNGKVIVDGLILECTGAPPSLP